MDEASALNDIESGTESPYNNGAITDDWAMRTDSWTDYR